MKLRNFRYSNSTSKTLSLVEALTDAGIEYELEVHVHQAIDRSDKEFIDYEVILPKLLGPDFGIKIKINKLKYINSIETLLAFARKIVQSDVIGKDPGADWTQNENSDQSKNSLIYQAQVQGPQRDVEMSGNTIFIPLNIASSATSFFSSLISLDESCLKDWGTTEFYELYQKSVFDDQLLQLNLHSTIDHVCKNKSKVDGFVGYKVMVNGFEVRCEWQNYNNESCTFQIHVVGDPARLKHLVCQEQFVLHECYDDLAIHTFQYEVGMDIESYAARMLSAVKTLA
jgi:hypothetical protein